jgi:hypothetical protein
MKQPKHTRRRTPVDVRFWAKVDKSGACWTWKASFRRDGYGRMFTHSGVVAAHRLAWELTNGPVPDGRYVLHRCDNRACVRPEHLFLGDHAANMADMSAKSRHAIVKGERHPRAKLTAEQVAEIRKLRSSGMLLRELAARFGIGTSYAGEVARGDRWTESGESV